MYYTVAKKIENQRNGTRQKNEVNSSQIVTFPQYAQNVQENMKQEQVERMANNLQSVPIGNGSILQTARVIYTKRK